LDDAFKHASSIAPQTYLQGIQIWTDGWTLFVLHHLQTARLQALFSYTWLCAQSPVHFAESAHPSGMVGCSLQWYLEAKINKLL